MLRLTLSALDSRRLAERKQVLAVTDKKDVEETNAQRERQQRVGADGEGIVSLDMDGEWVEEQGLSLSLI